MHRLALVIGLLLGLAFTSTTQAGLVLQIGNASIPENSSTPGYVDVTVFSDSSTAVDVADFSVTFSIASTNSGNILQFVSPQGSDFTTDASYIFSNNSGKVLYDNQDPMQTSDPYTQASGGDFSADFSDVSVLSSVLLVRLYLTDQPVGVGARLKPVAGDQFQISLVSGTYDDAEGHSGVLTVQTDAQPNGLVTITSVPEPGSGLHLLASLVPALLFWRARGKGASARERNDVSRAVGQVG